MIKRIFFLIMFFCIFSLNAFANKYDYSSSFVNVNIIPELTSITPKTKSLNLLLEISIKPHWHLYWKNPGDVGNPTTLNLKDTPYTNFVAPLFSTPKKVVYDDIITSYIHENTFYILQPITLDNLKNIKELPLDINLSYDVCFDECYNENIKSNITIPITSIENKNPLYIETYSLAETLFPETIDYSSTFSQNNLLINLSSPILKECTNAEFVSIYPKKNIISTLPKTKILSDTLLNIEFESINELPHSSNGIILCNNKTFMLSPKASSHPLSETSQNKNLFYHIIIAFLAGLILNLMPCVLPIISLKALQLVKNTNQKSIKSALAYMLGVISSFVLLATILYYFKKMSTSLGWGFQLQSIEFNLFLLILFFLIFLNLIGKLEIPDKFSKYLTLIPSSQNFITGFFAVIVATPCTGPFMGTAIGYAMLSSTTAYFLIFIALAIGYALPYTLIELKPQLIIKYLPKSGPWMTTLKHWLAIPIGLTCIWLFWVIFNQLNPTQTKEEINWQPYSSKNIEKALNNNQNVFINFTAKWCLVCMLNDKTTLSTKTFNDLAKQKNIALIKADWTTKDDTITNALKEYNRNSIPLYVYIKNDTKEKIVLPQILTTDKLKKVF